MAARRPSAPPAATAPPPDDRHELLAFDDPYERRTWVFDITFLLSSWTCVFGRGCPGVLTAPAAEKGEGCCSYGAHFVDDADHDDVQAAISRLTRQDWQFRSVGLAKGATRRTPRGQWMTRIHRGACIMLNRPGFPGGAGCALHRAALAAGERPLDWKPDVCWQLPLRLEEHTDEHGHVTSTLREWKRRDWGAGGFEFDWWCTDDPMAFSGGAPVYLALRDEIVALVGEEPYRILVAQVEQLVARGTPVPHPALRRRPTAR